MPTSSKPLRSKLLNRCGLLVALVLLGVAASAWLLFKPQHKPTSTQPSATPQPAACPSDQPTIDLTPATAIAGHPDNPEDAVSVDCQPGKKP